MNVTGGPLGEVPRRLPAADAIEIDGSLPNSFTSATLRKKLWMRPAPGRGVIAAVPTPENILVSENEMAQVQIVPPHPDPDAPAQGGESKGLFFWGGGNGTGRDAGRCHVRC